MTATPNNIKNFWVTKQDKVTAARTMKDLHFDWLKARQAERKEQGSIHYNPAKI